MHHLLQQHGSSSHYSSLGAICLLPASIFPCDYCSQEFIWFCNHCHPSLHGISLQEFPKVGNCGGFSEPQAVSVAQSGTVVFVSFFFFLHSMLIFLNSLILRFTPVSFLALSLLWGLLFFTKVILTSYWPLHCSLI